MAEDEGFEPPQTESESGVLPLHKSSIRGTFLLYPIFWKSQELFSKTIGIRKRTLIRVKQHIEKEPLHQG